MLRQLDIIPSGLRSVCSVTHNPLKDFGGLRGSAKHGLTAVWVEKVICPEHFKQ